MLKRTTDLPSADQAILAKVCESLAGNTRPRTLYWAEATKTPEGYDVHVRGIHVDRFLESSETEGIPEDFRDVLSQEWHPHAVFIVLAIEDDTLSLCQVRIEPTVLN